MLMHFHKCLQYIVCFSYNYNKLCKINILFYNTFYRKILPKVIKIFILNEEVNGNLLNKIKEIKWIF